MKLRILLTTLLASGAMLLAADDSRLLTPPKLKELAPPDFNKLLMKGLGNRSQAPDVDVLTPAETLHPRVAGRCAIRLGEYPVHDPDPAALLRIPAAAKDLDKLAIAPPVPPCPR